MPSVSLRTVWEIMRTAACAVLFFEKINIAFAVLILLKLTVDMVFTVLKAASSLENRVNIFLRNNKSRGFFVLCFS